MPQELHGQDFPTVLKNLLMEHTHTFSGGLMMTVSDEMADLIKLFGPAMEHGMDFQVKNYVKSFPPFRMVALDSQTADSLQKSYLYLYPSLNCIGLN